MAEARSIIKTKLRKGERVRENNEQRQRPVSGPSQEYRADFLQPFIAPLIISMMIWEFCNDYI